MAEIENNNIVKTMKLHINVAKDDVQKLIDVTTVYADVCTYISEYIFNNGFELGFMSLQEKIYHTIRDKFKLKSQMAISAIKTSAARYKSVKEQLSQKPYKYKDENGEWNYITRTLDWLYRPIAFRRPQADLVFNRDYSFVNDSVIGEQKLSLNTLKKRIYVNYDLPDNFKEYFDGTWKFGTGKIVSLNGEWYFHIPMTKAADKIFNTDNTEHLIGIDRGLRFLITTYDEEGKTGFVNGTDIMKKRDKFQAVRAELQSRGTKSAKRVLKRLTGRENRWMTDINHQISKTLVRSYGENTLFVIEDLTGVSFSEENLKNRPSDGRYELRSWSFYQFEQFLTYKANEIGAKVIKVPANYTSQRCPVCGRIHKENRNHNTHEYICDICGYRSNDDRIGAMNLFALGLKYVNGEINPHFSKN